MFAADVLDDRLFERVERGHWKAQFSSRYMVGKVPCGGFSNALALECVKRELHELNKEAMAAWEKGGSQGRQPIPAHPDILTCNCHFLSSVAPGEILVKVELLRGTKNMSTIQSSIFQGGNECMRMLVTCGNITAAVAKGPNIVGREHGKTHGTLHTHLLSTITYLLKGTPTSIMYPLIVLHLKNCLFIFGPAVLCLGKNAPFPAAPTAPDLPPIASCTRVNAGDNNPESVRSRVHLLVSPATATMLKDARVNFLDETTLKQGQAGQQEERLKRAEVGVSDYCGYAKFEVGRTICLPRTEHTFLFSSVA
jgi:hypothetical protein